MADSVKVTVTGADTVASTMRSAARAIGDLTDANRAAGDVIAHTAQAIAPRLTGRLASSTHGAGDKTTAGITNPLPYFGPIHYGWPARNIRAQPFVDDAVAQTRDRWLAEYEKAATKAADSVRGA